MSDPLIFGVDSGASGTRLALRRGHQSEGRDGLPSLNPAAVKDGASSWRRLIAAFDVEPHTEVRGCIATASMAPATADAVEAELVGAAAELSLAGSVLLINDAVARLYAPPLSGQGVLASVGTGTAYWARSSAGAVRTAAGYEYIAADEGGGFDIGRRGIQAAARAYDRRGPATSLLAAARRRYGLDIGTLGWRLATSPEQKRDVAEFAADVCRLADTDGVAQAILVGAVESILDGIAAVISNEQDSTGQIGLAGGLIASPNTYSRMLRRAIYERWPSLSIRVVPQDAEALLALVHKLEDIAIYAAPPVAARVVVL